MSGRAGGNLESDSPDDDDDDDDEEVDSLKTGPDRKYFARQRRGIFACASEVIYLKQLEEEGRASIDGDFLMRIRDDFGTCVNFCSLCDLSLAEELNLGVWRKTSFISLKDAFFFGEALDWICPHDGCG